MVSVRRKLTIPIRNASQLILLDRYIRTFAGDYNHDICHHFCMEIVDIHCHLHTGYPTFYNQQDIYKIAHIFGGFRKFQKKRKKNKKRDNGKTKIGGRKELGF